MGLKSCAVPSCRSNSYKTPNLRFFPLPSDKYMRQEWLEVISLSSVTEISVCELHFREKDFTSSGRLKCHAVPTVKGGKFDDRNSDDEFMQCGNDSGSDLEIIEVKNLSREDVKVKKEPAEERKLEKKIKAPTPPPEVETGRRPSRRAAQVAAQKIQNTVRQYGLGSDSIISESISRSPQIKSEYKPRRTAQTPPKNSTRRQRDQKVWHQIRAPLPDIDLTMECHEELLSPIQAEMILKAQMEYNAVMKRLRNLKASNARIICMNGDETEIPSSPGAVIQPTSLTIPQKGSHIVTLPAMTTCTPNVITVVPVHLVTVQTQPSIHAIKPPSSPAVYANITAD